MAAGTESTSVEMGDAGLVTFNGNQMAVCFLKP